jgi:hypothetical protein
MKKLVKIVGVLVIIIVVGLFGLQIFFNHGLTPVVQKMLPKVSEELGMDVSVEKVSVNLFKGSLDIAKLSLGNPEGFSDPSIFALDRAGLDVVLRDLLQREVRISDAAVKNAIITLVRNQEGKVNLTEIQKNLKKDRQQVATDKVPDDQAPAKPESSSSPAAEAAAEVVELPKVEIVKLGFNLLFEFIDYKTTNTQPRRIGLDLKLDAENITTFGEKPEDQWGTITINGGLHENPKRFAVNINARVAPLTDPAAPSFDAKGKIASVNMEDLGSLPDEVGVIGSSADIELNIMVRDGHFAKESKLIATLHDARLIGKLARKHKKTKLPPNISITIPINGSLDSPEVNIVQAVTASILRNVAKNPDYLLDNITVDGKSMRDRLNRALEGKKKNKERK